MTATSQRVVAICLAGTLFLSAVAFGQEGQSGDVRVKDPSETLPAQSPLAPDRLFALASPAVVKLTIKDEDDREIGVASGFIVGTKKEDFEFEGRPYYTSTIVTNYHVIRPAVGIDVLFAEGHSGWVLKVIAEDEFADLAVLSAYSSVEPKQALKLRRSANPPIGTKAFAIGSPRGLSNTLSEGLISGYRQRGEHQPWIQITAPISPGSSGGPLLSAEGSVLGVTTAFLSEGQNLNFAVPASEVARLLAQKGEPRPIWEGASTSETQRDVLGDAFVSLYMSFSNEKQSTETPEEDVDEFDVFWEEQIGRGDQLALLVKGDRMRGGEKHDDAIVMLRRATNADPGEYAYLTHFALALAIRRRAITSATGDLYHSGLEDSVEQLKRAKELNAEFGPTYYWLCLTYSLLDKHPERLVEAESLIRLMPRCYSGYRERAIAWADLGREEAFERDIQTACELRPMDHYLLIAKADGYLRLDKYQKAVDTYRAAFEIDEKSSPAHFNLGSALQTMGKYDEAIKEYQLALKLGGHRMFRVRTEEKIRECRLRMQLP